MQAGGRQVIPQATPVCWEAQVSTEPRMVVNEGRPRAGVLGTAKWDTGPQMRPPR